MTSPQDRPAAAEWLRTPEAVRARCGAVFAAARDGTLAHFALNVDALEVASDYTVATIRDAYPDLNIPYHSRWRHFAVGGTDRWPAVARYLSNATREEVARSRFDVAVVSVLLDAGAGAQWRYIEPATGAVYARSEGLALASLEAFAGGLFSAHEELPLRADAAALDALDADRLGAVFQAAPDNPLIGLEGRTELLRRLAAALRARPELFGAEGRVGNLYDYLAAQAIGDEIPATAILDAVLEGFASIWPGRIEIDGVNLGDVWRHPAAGGDGATAGLVPFHKLSQWLTYSLVEPLEEAGFSVTDLDALTGLPEYRNGGLFVDTGVLVPKQAGILTQTHEVGSEVVVEWRALTVVLLDMLAERVRRRLGLDARSLPLAKVLQGGTWAAGRRVARERRDGGGPPIAVASDGTVF